MSKTNHKTRICPICGKEFVYHGPQKYCCHECKKKADLEAVRGGSGRHDLLPKKRKKGESGIPEKNAKAREKGMTYGELQKLKTLEMIDKINVTL